jgi:hypothetical protein
MGLIDTTTIAKAMAMAAKRPAPVWPELVAKRAHEMIVDDFERMNGVITGVMDTAQHKRLYDLAKRTSSMLFLAKSVEMRSNYAGRTLMDALTDCVSELRAIATDKAFARLDKYESSLDDLQPEIDTTVAEIAAAYAKAKASTDEQKVEFSRIDALCARSMAKIAEAQNDAMDVQSEIEDPCPCPVENIKAATALLLRECTVLAETELPRAYEAAKVTMDVEKKAKIEAQCQLIAKWLRKAARALDHGQYLIPKTPLRFAVDATEEFERLWALVPFFG